MALFYAAFFLKLSDNDDWLLAFRKEHDPKSLLVQPHITLFFPTSDFSEEKFVEEMRRQVETLNSFEAVFKTAILMPERNGEEFRADIFLVPDQGFRDIVKLHDKLYSGVLKPALRLDVPFIPHITIGADLDLKTAKCLVDQLNSKNINLSIKVDHFDIVKIEASHKVGVSVARIDL